MTSTETKWDSVVARIPDDRVIVFCEEKLLCFDIDNGTDLSLTIFVSPEKLTKASPDVFMFEPNWQNKEQRVDKMPSDNPQVMLILLAIIHDEKRFIPDKVCVIQLYGLLAHARQFGLTGSLGPHRQDWMPTEKERTDSPDKEYIAWIAWEIGAKEIYNEMVNHLGSMCSGDGKGSIRWPETPDPIEEYLAEARIIVKVRNRLLGFMFTELRKIMKFGENDSKHCLKIEPTDSYLNHDPCTGLIRTMMTAESLTTIWGEQGFDVALLFDQDVSKHPDYSGSATELRNTLLSVEVNYDELHDHCNPFEGMKRKLGDESYLEHLDVVSTQEKLDQFQARAQISGWKPQ
ncbi:hypothetical protein CTAM01_12969 [Colletotrichum tamarilloi]|uniref:Uncharacterized protein n=1 Tax=Colletotrichum tamarilloi TaxID=1209934 RepID=A0ABQ9QT93_9PEZI|nr:uncharacterized protein CTAM01_12969 [Colletotrichum tamarilloi]KAK1484464.1 hypothetical protein CTAM01_12969 [Colletotrichum tamarilloi]